MAARRAAIAHWGRGGDSNMVSPFWQTIVIEFRKVRGNRSAGVQPLPQRHQDTKNLGQDADKR